VTEPLLLNLNPIAEHLSVGPHTVDRLTAIGDVDAAKVGRKIHGCGNEQMLQNDSTLSPRNGVTP